MLFTGVLKEYIHHFYKHRISKSTKAIMHKIMPESEYSIVIIYPTDPLGPGIGGIKTFINGFIKYAPENFSIKFIGISSNNKKRPSKKWTRLSLGYKNFDFFPLFFERDENKKTLIPLSLRFTVALKFSKLKIGGKILFFNRIEPAILFRKKVGFSKVAVVHSDVINQLTKGKSDIIWNKIPWVYFMLEKYIFNFLDVIYVVNKSTLRFYQSKYQEQKEKFYSLPTWVDKKIFYPINKSKEKIRQNLITTDKRLPRLGKWILFVGRLQEEKSPILLIKTFAEYHKQDSDSYLLIIGEGNLRQKMKDYARKLGLVQSVYFIAYKSQVELAEYYRAADVLLLTSNYEAMPICVLEALGSGLPVVSTDVGEVRRIINSGFSGEVVGSVSPLNIFQAIKKVLDNPKIYSKDNCIKAVSDYTPQKVLEYVYKTIRKLQIYHKA